MSILSNMFASNSIKYDKKNKKFTVEFKDKETAQFIELVTASFRGVTIKGKKMTFVVQEHTTANEVLALLTAANALK